MQYVERNHMDPNSRQIGTATLASQPAFTGNGLCEDRWVLSDKICVFVCTVVEGGGGGVKTYEAFIRSSSPDISSLLLKPSACILFTIASQWFLY
jgi:hypothetical protein